MARQKERENEMTEKVVTVHDPIDPKAIERNVPMLRDPKLDDNG